jgi:hypothetical protein
MSGTKWIPTCREMFLNPPSAAAQPAMRNWREPMCNNVCLLVAGLLVALHAREIRRWKNTNLVNLHRVYIQKR